jgi:hypothetical protein
MSRPDVRKGMPPRRLERRIFEQRFKSAFVDPVFAPLQRELQAITDAAWDGDRIYAAAAKVYARGRRGSYDVVDADF